MAVMIEGKKAFFLADRARLLDSTPHEVAWAEKYVKPDPAKSWVLGKYVEADKANHNRQFWALNDLRVAQPTISHAPMNMLHRPRAIVGSFVATELVYPVSGEAAGQMMTCPDCGAEMPQGTKKCPKCGYTMDASEMAYEYANPYIEALGVFWKYYFPEEYKAIEAAHASGSLFFSMECVAKSLTCGGDLGCGTEFAYDGPRSDSYCEHLNEGASFKQLNEPHFLAGALIIPPERPGWSGAEIQDISSLVKDHAQECEVAYNSIREESPDLTPAQWEFLMYEIVSHAKSEARQFTQQKRDDMAKKGAAMPDGSFPIENVSDLKNAIQAVGRAKDPAAAKSHIKKRAKALGHPELIPASWS